VFLIPFENYELVKTREHSTIKEVVENAEKFRQVGKIPRFAYILGSSILELSQILRLSVCYKLMTVVQFKPFRHVFYSCRQLSW